MSLQASQRKFQWQGRKAILTLPIGSGLVVKLEGIDASPAVRGRKNLVGIYSHFFG